MISRSKLYSLSLDGKPFCPFNDVVFTTQKFTLKQFWELHKDKLPVILKVEEGYYGGLDFDVYSSGDILYVVKCSCQKRVVAKDLLREQYLSIPVDYDLQVRLLDNEGDPVGEPTQLSDIIKDNKLPLSVDVVQKRTQFKFFIQADQDYQMEFETLRLVETYDERYLLAHTVMTGELSIRKACVIPMYLPLAVLMALGPARGDLNEWNKLASRMKDGPEQSVYDDHPMNTDLMIFNEEDVVSSDGIYDYIEPKHFVKFDKTKGTLAAFPAKLRTPLLYPGPVVKKPSYLQHKRPPPPIPTTETEKNKEINQEGGHKRKTSKEQVTAVISPIFKAVKSKFNKVKEATMSKSASVSMLSSSDEEDYEEVNDLTDRAKTMLSKTQTPHSMKSNVSPQSSTASSKIQTWKWQSPSSTSPQASRTTTTSPGLQNSAVIPPSTITEPKDKPPVKDKPKFLKSISNDSGTSTGCQDADKEDIYQTLQAVPKDISRLSVTQVGECLKMLNMEEYVEKFESEKVDGVLLMELDVGDLQEAFGMSRMMAKKLCLFGKQQWRPEK